MKLHEALRKIFKLFGIAVIKEKRLVFLLADYKAFDDFPAMKQVMEAIVTGRYGRELSACGLLMTTAQIMSSTRSTSESPLSGCSASGKNSLSTQLTASPLPLVFLIQ